METKLGRYALRVWAEYYKVVTSLMLVLMFTLGCNIQQSDLEEAAKQTENDRTTIVTVVDPGMLTILPNYKQMLVNQEVQFSAAGGEAPYTFSLYTGPGTLGADQKYLAPGAPGNAVVRVTDSKGATADALITISVEFSLLPADQYISVNTTAQYGAIGGNPPYTYSIASGGGTMSAGGLFTAPGSAGTTILRATDLFGNITTTKAEIGFGPIISPTFKKIPVNSSFTFSVSGGTGTPNFTKITASEPGTINSLTGMFTASASFGTTAIRVYDGNGQYYSDAIIESFVPNKVSASTYSTCILNGNTNKVKCVGFDQSGALGRGGMIVGDDVSDMGDNLRPVVLATDRFPINISSGGLNACAILDDNSVQCWGYGPWGNNGYNGVSETIANGTMGDFISFVPIGNGRTIVQMSSNYYHNCAVLDNASVKCWAYNGWGNLGTDDTQSWGSNQTTLSLYNMTPINLGQGALKVVTGTHHSCALLADGSVKCWGYNAQGQLGRDDNVQWGDNAGEMAALGAINLGGTPAIDISAGYLHSCALLNNGRVRCWGYNAQGQLGISNTTQMGDNLGEMAALTDLSLGASPGVKIYSGGYHNCALLANGNVKCWGYNLYGQLGVGDAVDRNNATTLASTPLGAGKTVLEMALGEDWTCAILNDSSVKCWGRNTFGQLGLGHTDDIGKVPADMGDNLAAINLGTNVTALKIAASNYSGHSTCVVAEKDSQNRAYCWGRGLYGEHGNMGGAIGIKPSDMGGNLKTVDLGTATVVKGLTGNYFGHCANFADEQTKCWGFHTTSYGMTGVNYIVPPGKPASVIDYIGDILAEMGSALAYLNPGIGMKMTSMAATRAVWAPHACGLFEPIVPDGSNPVMKCWGYGGYGQLGQSNTSNYIYIPSISPINLGVGRYATQMSVATYHDACARLDDGTVKCWGYNFYGQLGQGDQVDRGTAAVGYTMADLLPVNLGTGVTAKAVYSCQQHSCAVTSDDRLKCWGYNAQGELGQGHTNNIGDGAGEMGDNLPYTNLGTGRTVKKFVCGTHYSCAILDNNKLKCWGGGGFGQLGNESTGSLGGGTSSTGNNLRYVDVGTGRTVVDIEAGYYHTCAVLDNNDVKCWGWNNYGQLGLGRSDNVGNEVGEMGDNLPPLSF